MGFIISRLNNTKSIIIAIPNQLPYFMTCISDILSKYVNIPNEIKIIACPFTANVELSGGVFSPSA